MFKTLIKILIALTIICQATGVKAQAPACYEGQEYDNHNGSVWKFVGGKWKPWSGFAQGQPPDAPCVAVVSNPIAPTAQVIPTSSGSSYGAAFSSDVTPDGLSISAGGTFTKSWGMKNTGLAAWDSTFIWVTTNPGGLTVISTSIVPTTPSGSVATVTVTYRVPSTNGQYKAWAQMKAPNGTLFGTIVWTTVNVVGGSAPASVNAVSTGNTTSLPAGSCVTTVTSSSITLCPSSGVPYNVTPQPVSAPFTVWTSAGTEELLPVLVCTVAGVCQWKTERLSARPNPDFPPAKSITQLPGITHYTYVEMSGSPAAGAITRRVVATNASKWGLTLAEIGAANAILLTVDVASGIMTLQWLLVPAVAYQGIPAVTAPAVSIGDGSLTNPKTMSDWTAAGMKAGLAYTYGSALFKCWGDKFQLVDKFNMRPDWEFNVPGCPQDKAGLAKAIEEIKNQILKKAQEMEKAGYDWRAFYNQLGGIAK